MAEKSIDQYYKTLGVAPGASKKEIEKAYKYKKQIYRYEPSDNLASNFNMKPYLLAELQEIEEAYQKILLHQANTSTASESSARFKNRDDYEAWKASKIKESQGQQSSLNDNSTYYQILGLKSSASKEEIKQAYKDLLNVWNPDRFSTEPSLQQKAQQKIKEIDDAYEKLLIYFDNKKENFKSTPISQNRDNESQSNGKVIKSPLTLNDQTGGTGRKLTSSRVFTPTMLVIIALIINLGYVITKTRTLAEFIGFSIGYCGGVAALSYIIAKITARKNPAGFRLHFGWSFVFFTLLLIFGNIYF